MENPIEIDKSVRYSYNILKNITQLPKNTIGNILDITYDKFNTLSATLNIHKNIKNCYNNVMLELILKSRPKCGPECRFVKICWFEGEPLNIPVLCRSTHKICIKCNYCSVSQYDFNTCYECATENEFPIEFEYYHRWCN